MIIETPEGPKNIGIALLTPSKLPASVTAARREWVTAWNTSATIYNKTVETAQTFYGRMMDCRPLPLIPDGESEIPGFDRATGKIAGWND